MWAFIMGNWRVLLAATAVSTVLGFGGGWELKSLLVDRAALVQAKADAKAKEIAQAAADKAAKDWEEQLRLANEANRKLQGRLRNEIKKTVYTACVLPSDGVQLYNDALAGTSTAEPGDAMP